MKKLTFLLVLAGIFLMIPSCKKSDSTDPPPVVKDPYGMFEYTKKANGIVTFYNTSTDATSYSWDFGDGQTSTTAVASFDHQYLQNGAYHATLTAYGNGKSSGAYADLNITSVVGGVPTVETDSVTNITQTTATSGGNITSEGGSAVTARGVCWSMTQNPTISDNKTNDGNGTGGFTSDITGLAANTPYYVRAYATNSSGTAYGNQVIFRTLSAFTCGSSMTIDHVAGAIAPVAKTVNYGTVTNIPGETSKCWITSNLGADHQATSKDDATEASAGWYWQFNRKQGYKHDGTTRTPNTPWISFINENSDWILDSDPCRIEMGSNWRIPTYTEWYNVHLTGGWTNWNGPWNSALKIHVAGHLDFSDELLYGRGRSGYYWGSTQGDTYHAGWLVDIYKDESCWVTQSFKGNAYSLRCLKD